MPQRCPRYLREAIPILYHYAQSFFVEDGGWGVATKFVSAISKYGNLCTPSIRHSPPVRPSVDSKISRPTQFFASGAPHESRNWLAVLPVRPSVRRLLSAFQSVGPGSPSI